MRIDIGRGSGEGGRAVKDPIAGRFDWGQTVVALSAAVALTLMWLGTWTPDAETEPGVVELTFSGQGPLSGALEDAVRMFEAESRLRHAEDPTHPIYRVISGQTASRNVTDDPTRFLVSLAGGSAPDVISFDRFAVAEWAARGAFVDVAPYLERDRAMQHPDAIRPEAFYEAAWDEVVFEDPVAGRSGVFAIPNGIDNRAFFYNKDLLRRAGYVDESGEARPPRTWEELEEAAVALSEFDASGRLRRAGFVPNYGNSWLYLYGWMNGGEFMSPDGRRCTLDDPRIVEALRWMTGVYDKLGGASNVYAFQSGAQGEDLHPFVTGKVGMMIDGFWTLAVLMARHGDHLNWGVAPPPMPQRVLEAGGHPISWTGGFSFAIPSTARNPEGGWALIRFLASRRAVAAMAESERALAESQGRPFIPLQHPNREINEALVARYVHGNPRLSPALRAGVDVFTELLPASRFRPVTPVGQMLWNEHINAMEQAIFHKRTPDGALAHATAVVQRELSRHLAPPPGPVVPWGAVLIAYLSVLAVAVGAVLWWDVRWRQRRRWLAQLPIGRAREWLDAPSDAEGARGQAARREWVASWLCAGPWWVGFVVFTGGPLFYSMLLSLCEYDVLHPPRFVGLRNFVEVLTDDPLFWVSLWNTAFMMLGIPLGMAVSLGLALLLNTEARGLAGWRTVFFLPSIVPAVAASILWLWIFNPTSGLLNGVLASVGIQGPNWLQDERTSKLALILMGLWGAGGGMIIWLAGLKGISRTFYEAAELDGATPFQQFRHVTVPLLTPYIFFNLIMGLIGTFQIFTQAFVMTAGGPVNSTLFYAYHLFNNAFRYLKMGHAAAMAWILFVIVFVLTLIQFKISERWVHYEHED